jgi:hypothetical protein
LTRLLHSPHALCAYGFMCGYLDTQTWPRQLLAQLARPRLQHPTLSAILTSAQRVTTSFEHISYFLYSSSFYAEHHPQHSRYCYPFWPSTTQMLFTTLLLRAWGMLKYISDTERLDRDRNCFLSYTVLPKLVSYSLVPLYILVREA